MVVALCRTGAFLPACREVRDAALHIGCLARLCGALHGVFRRADRLAARRSLPDHFHPRTGSLDVDDHFSGHGLLGCARAGLQDETLGHDVASTCAYWCLDDMYRALDRSLLGQTHLGYLLGLGRAHHLGIDPLVSLLRRDRIESLNRRRPESRQGLRADGDCRCGQRPDYLFLGEMVEHLAPRRHRLTHRSAQNGANHADCHADHDRRSLALQHRQQPCSGSQPDYRARAAIGLGSLAVKDHSFYILMSYGAFALVLLIELYALRMQRTRAVKEAKRMDESMDSTRDAEVNRASDAADHEALLAGDNSIAPQAGENPTALQARPENPTASQQAPQGAAAKPR